MIALGLAGTAVAGVAAAAVPSVIGGGSGGAVAPAGVRVHQTVVLAAMRSRVFASLSTSAGDVLRVDITQAAGSSGACPVTRWVYPFDAAAGQEFRALIEASPSCGAQLAKTIDIPDAQPLIVGSGPGQPLDAEGLYMTGAGTVRAFDAATGAQTQTDVSDLEVDAGPVPEVTRRQLADGTLHQVGQPIVDGRSTFELSVQGSQVGAFTLWVDAISYLPVREYLPSSGIRMDFTFLPATQANLANLRFLAPGAGASGSRG